MDNISKIFFWGINGLALISIGIGGLGLTIISMNKDVALGMVLVPPLVPIMTCICFTTDYLINKIYK